MKKVKFKKAGKWAENNTLLQQIVIEKDGDEALVSDELAEIIVTAGAGSIVGPTEAELQEQEDEKLRQAEEAQAEADKNAGLEVALATAKEDISKLNDSLAIKSKQCDELEAANTAANEKIAGLEKLVGENITTIEDLQKQLAAANEKPAAKDKEKPKKPAAKDKEKAES